jgi:hypothetical protein
MDVDADADDSVGDLVRFGARFDEDAAGFARADEQIVGPAEVDGQAGHFLDRLSGGEAGNQWQHRQSGWECSGAAGR